MNRRLAPSITALLIAAASAAGLAQSTPQTNFRSKVELVQLDVVVRDRENRPVRGLTKDDFEIVEPGQPDRPRQIATFDEVHHEPQPLGPWTTPVRLDVADNHVALDDRLVIFAIDDTHVRKEYTKQMRDVSREAIMRLGPGATMVLLTTSGRHRIEATTDISVLLAEVERVMGSEEHYVLLPPIEVRTDGARTLTQPPPASTQQFQSSYRITLNALGDAARALITASARRKALVWISNGVDRLGEPDATGLSQKFFAGMLEKMAAAHVVTYAIDPIGTSAPMPGAGKALKVVKASGLTVISQRTGGFAFVNDDDMTKGLEKIADDLDNYYLLGFYPDPPPKGYQKVTVRVKRPGLTVRTREGYDLSASADAATKAATTPMASLAASGVPVAEFPLRVFAAALPGEGGKTRVPVLFTFGGAATQGEFEIYAVDQDAMKVVARLTGRAKSPSLPLILELTPGRYQLRVFVTSGGHRASVFSQLTVPDFSNKTRAVTLSSVIVGSDEPTGPYGAFPIAPTMERSFASSATLRFYAEVTSATPSTATLTIVDAHDRVIGKDSPPVTAGRIQAQLKLAQLPAGAYRIQLRVTDGTSTDEREVGIVVR